MGGGYARAALRVAFGRLRAVPGPCFFSRRAKSYAVPSEGEAPPRGSWPNPGPTCRRPLTPGPPFEDEPGLPLLLTAMAPYPDDLRPSTAHRLLTRLNTPPVRLALTVLAILMLLVLLGF